MFIHESLKRKRNAFPYLDKHASRALLFLFHTILRILNDFKMFDPSKFFPVTRFYVTSLLVTRYFVTLFSNTPSESKPVHSRYSRLSQAWRTAKPIRIMSAVSNWFRRRTSNELTVIHWIWFGSCEVRRLNRALDKLFVFFPSLLILFSFAMQFLLLSLLVTF